MIQEDRNTNGNACCGAATISELANDENAFNANRQFLCI